MYLRLLLSLSSFLSMFVASTALAALISISRDTRGSSETQRIRDRCQFNGHCVTALPLFTSTPWSTLIDSLNSPLRWICRMRADHKTNRFGNNRRRKAALSLSLPTGLAGRHAFCLDFTVFNFVPEKLFNLQPGALRRFSTSARAELRSISGLHASPRSCIHAFAFPF